MINIEHVSKQFGSLQVLEDISINIDQGDIFGIIGQSGAGKSTLLRCINGTGKVQRRLYYSRRKGDRRSQPERTSVGAQGHGNDLPELQSVRPSECV